MPRPGQNIQRSDELPLPLGPPAPTPPVTPPVISDEALYLTDTPVPGGRKAPLAPPTAAELWIETASTEAQLQAAAAACADLADHALEPNPFYEPWMLLAALRELATDREVEIVLVWGPHPSRRKGARQLCGLFPIEWRGRGLLRAAQLWQHRYCYLCTPLVRAGVETQAMSRALDWLAERAAIIKFGEVSAEGPVHHALVDELGRRRWGVQLGDAYTRAILRTAANGDDFLEKALAGKRRKELRRQRSRLAEHGRLEACALEDPGELSRWVEDFVALEQKSWKGRCAVSLASDPSHLRWFQQMSEQAQRQGRLMMLGLRLDDRPIALKLNLLAGDGSFAFKIAFDESFARYSPGVQLELDNVHRVHQQPGLRWMDSCAAADRFMINHLWPDRRGIHTLFFAPGGGARSLLLALLPLARWARERVQGPATDPRSSEEER